MVGGGLLVMLQGRLLADFVEANSDAVEDPTGADFNFAAAMGDEASQGCLKVDSGAVFGELNAAQPQHSFDVVRQRAQTPSN